MVWKWNFVVWPERNERTYQTSLQTTNWVIFISTPCLYLVIQGEEIDRSDMVIGLCCWNNTQISYGWKWNLFLVCSTCSQRETEICFSWKPWNLKLRERCVKIDNNHCGKRKSGVLPWWFQMWVSFTRFISWSEKPAVSLEVKSWHVLEAPEKIGKSYQQLPGKQHYWAH